jgi:hypothetical protein
LLPWSKLFVVEEAMLHFFSRSACIIGAPLTLVALLSCVTPAGAKITANGMTMQALSATAVAQNEIPARARITTGSALTDLNGVAVEAVIIPETAIH